MGSLLCNWAIDFKFSRDCGNLSQVLNKSSPACQNVKVLMPKAFWEVPTSRACGTIQPTPNGFTHQSCLWVICWTWKRCQVLDEVRGNFNRRRDCYPSLPISWHFVPCPHPNSWQNLRKQGSWPRKKHLQSADHLHWDVWSSHHPSRLNLLAVRDAKGTVAWDHGPTCPTHRALDFEMNLVPADLKPTLGLVAWNFHRNIWVKDRQRGVAPNIQIRLRQQDMLKGKHNILTELRYPNPETILH